MPFFASIKFCASKNTDYESMPYKQVSKPTTIQKQGVNHLKKLKQNVIIKDKSPKFHSTKLEQSSINFANKFTSTAIQNSFDQSDSIGDSTSFYSCNDSANSEDEDIQDVMIYVCVRSYQAQYQGDISISYSDRVKVLHVNEDFALIKNLTSYKSGYVSTSSLTSLNEFLKQN